LDLLVKTDTGWTAAPSATFANEAEFQSVVQETFGQALVAQAEVPTVVAREVATVEGGRIDVVSIDVEGVISLCECKLDRNAGSRREVLGQVLEYGASFHGLEVDDFLDRLSTALQRRNAASGTFEEELAARAAEDWDPDEWRTKVAQSLEEGQFRFVIAVDALTETLKQTVLFLNDRTKFPIVVAEMRRLSVGAATALMPRFFGEEAVARKLPRRRSSTVTVTDPDTVVVPATDAIEEFERLSAYVCQPERAFRDVEYLGFYGQRAIDPRFPRIVGRRMNVPFTTENAANLKDSGGDDARFGEVIQRALSDNLRPAGQRFQIFLLDLSGGFTLPKPIAHPPEVGRAAWTQNQRYSRRDALEAGPDTTADLAEAGG
jgi:hypothetical protein